MRTFTTENCQAIQRRASQVAIRYCFEYGACEGAEELWKIFLTNGGGDFTGLMMELDLDYLPSVVAIVFEVSFKKAVEATRKSEQEAEARFADRMVRIVCHNSLR